MYEPTPQELEETIAHLRDELQELSEAAGPLVSTTRMTIDGKPKRLTWQEYCRVLQEDNLRLQKWATMVADLDRSRQGRHEGDVESGAEGGVSQGNPHMSTGDVIGYDISGNLYVVPPVGKRHLIDEWKKQRNG